MLRAALGPDPEQGAPGALRTLAGWQTLPDDATRREAARGPVFTPVRPVTRAPQKDDCPLQGAVLPPAALPSKARVFLNSQSTSGPKGLGEGH